MVITLISFRCGVRHAARGECREQGAKKLRAQSAELEIQLRGARCEVRGNPVVTQYLSL